MKASTLLDALILARDDQEAIAHARHDSYWFIAVADDGHAKQYRKRRRQCKKFVKRLRQKLEKIDN